MTNKEVGEVTWNINVANPEPPPKRGGRSTTILVVRDVIDRFLSRANTELVKSVVDDFGARDDMGFKKHGQNLESNDGRFTEKDAYEELLDAAQYYRKLIIEEPENHHAVRMYDKTLALVMDARFGLMNKDAMVDAMKWGGPNDEDVQRGYTEDTGTEGTDETPRHRPIIRK